MEKGVLKLIKNYELRISNVQLISETEKIIDWDVYFGGGVGGVLEFDAEITRYEAKGGRD
jgi:hypothetical protein